MARAAGDLAGWGLLIGLAAAVALAPIACTGTGTDDAPVSPTLRALLADVGPEVVVPALERFRASLPALDAATAALAAAPDEAHLADARAAWIDAMRAWQEAEVHQIGPSASSLQAVAGGDLRDEIYSWPTTNPCRIDQLTVDESWRADDFFTANRVNAYGLDAVEHTLFGPAETVCAAQIGIDEDWAALGADGVAERRAAFAVVLVGGLIDQTDALIEAWGSFAGALAQAGEIEPYTTAQSGLNAVFDALFYLETATKDRKLGAPLGLVDCSGAACIDQVEAPASEESIAWVRANLVGFRDLFTGDDGTGMDDLLAEVGHADLSAAVIVAVDAALAACDAIDGPLPDAIAADRPAVEALFAAVKVVTDLLKGDVATVLTLALPDEAAGDAD